MANESQDESIRQTLIAVDLALVLAEATGRRLGSIQKLRWEHLDLKRNTITWRAENDKTGRAEEVAGLAKLKGGLWHPYRRKWATERKHLPLKDVKAAGGWTDTETLLRCCQHADRATLLEVMSVPKKLTEAAQNG